MEQVVTINDKHLEKHEQQGGDKPLAGAQITKPEDRVASSAWRSF
jgi:hypothetical protein